MRFLILIALFCCAQISAQEIPNLTAADFAKLPSFKAPRISPDGKYLASTIIVKSEPVLLVQSTDSTIPKEKREITPIRLGDTKINWYRWANNDRLVLNVRFTTKYRSDQVNVDRLVSVGRDGKNMVVFKNTPNKSGYFRQLPNVLSWLKDDPEYILAELDDKEDSWNAPEVDKVNVYTGKKERILRNFKSIQEWLADNNGVVRIGINRDTGSNRRLVKVYHRFSEDDDWDLLFKSDEFDHERLIPRGFHPNNDNILIVSSIELEEKNDASLFQYDIKLQKIIGAYVDEKRESVLTMLKKAVPEATFEIESFTRDKSIYYVRAYADDIAPIYLRFDMKLLSLDAVAYEYPSLQDAILSKMEKVTYTARDGLTIPAFLTKPLNSKTKNLPMVIYPHGGPWSHDEWGFDNYVQFFASQGYAVFQPQFRGSTGYGVEHKEKSYGQWGYTIQDDITDGVKWLIDQGIADPNKICIVGASFGGYAAAMGLAKTPKLYQCGVSISGVLNLEKYLRDLTRDFYGNIYKITSNDKDTAEEVSPYHLIEKIKAPLLLIHGSKDTVVPVEHSREMYEEMQDQKKQVEYIELENGEHWRTNETNEIKTLQALEKFLAKYLK